ncbi:glycosyltransferase family 2 protein [Microbulbifer salipaludis]|uniref:Glycosyltransferase family 2 protein n=1 Tax=Microbulbifer salipaludis TaxID=187980 RepID=A0ABS3E6A6_9GAMM|nr:glycosyltransferase family 2 protein [Microbulbifer salipaludis]MBN8430837.1 glycosyltransferase family 2 protein [Microbulbifer salipaludis]
MNVWHEVLEAEVSNAGESKLVSSTNSSSRAVGEDEVLTLTILMPCLNEERTLAECIEDAYSSLQALGIDGEIVIADNGSSDRSKEIALSYGARVISVAKRGYGAALMAGIEAARGQYVIMGDADCSYDFGSLEGFLDTLKGGADLVCGNRFQGGIEPGAMPFLHRYLGNPVLSYLGRLFYKIKIGDFHCGLRGFNREKILGLGLDCPGMEFASEMIVKAAKKNLVIREIPTVLRPDKRDRKPHLRTWRDGWRHLRFLLMHSPGWMLGVPGWAAIALGMALIVSTLMLQWGPFGVVFGANTLIFAMCIVSLGGQLVQFSNIVAYISFSVGASEKRVCPERLAKANLLTGGAFTLFGGGLSAYSLHQWWGAGFGELEYGSLFSIVIPASLLLFLGVTNLLSSLIVYLLSNTVFRSGVGRAAA